MSLIDLMEASPEAAGFDYGQLPPEVAADAREVARRVRAGHRRTMQAILDMGRELARIKRRLGHGQFGPWLAAEFGGAARTAQNYMLAAERFAAQSEAIAYLPPSTVYRLAAPSTPERLRDAVVERLAAGERPDAREIDALVREAREAERERLRPGRRAAAQTARRDALALLKARLGEDLPRFLALLEAAGRPAPRRGPADRVRRGPKTLKEPSRAVPVEAWP